MLCPYCETDNIPGVDVCESCGSDLAGIDLPEAGRGLRGRLMTDAISDLEISETVSVLEDATVADAVEAMRDAQRGCVLVMSEAGELVGLFNERHLLTRVVRKSLDAAATRVSAVMSPDPLRLAPEDPPAFAIHCMVDYGFRHLPVVSGTDVHGFISVRNVLAYLNSQVLAR